MTYNYSDLLDMQQSDLPQKRQLRFEGLQEFCNNLLALMEKQDLTELDYEDPKSLLLLESMIKSRSRLLDFEKQIQEESAALARQVFYQNQLQREHMINGLIQKINRAVRDM